MDDYYEVLGLSHEATGDEIKSAFRRKARECHPDVNPSDMDAPARFRMAVQAYEWLGDPQRREGYDRQLGIRQRAGAPDFDIKLTFLQASLGCDVPVAHRYSAACQSCDGVGACIFRCDRCGGTGRAVVSFSEMFSAQGRPRGGPPGQCRECRGRKYVIEDPCGDCRGSGRVQEQYVFTVRVPKRIKDGQVLRVQDPRIGERYIRIHIEGW
jgi:molecular chaperone DnaJ